MTRYWPKFALVLTAAGLAGCNDVNNTFQPNTGALINFVSPANVTAGGPGFTLTLNGAGFVDKSVVRWNGQARATKFIDSTQVSATITAADIVNPGRFLVSALNPPTSSRDNGLSNTLTFIVDTPSNPVPTITTISPTSAIACGAACGAASFTMTIAGSKFLPGTGGTGASIVHWNTSQQTNLTPSSITASQIQVTIPGSLISAVGAAIVTVFNPLPGGGTSDNGQPFTILPGPAAGGGPAAAAANSPAISADGRFVAYTGYDGGQTQIFLHDSCLGAQAGCQEGTRLISTAADGAAGNGGSRSPAISFDGRFIAFSSTALNLADDAAPGSQIYLGDTCFSADAACRPSTAIVSIDSEGKLSGAENILPTISGSGRFVAFVSVTPARAADAATRNAPASPNSGYRQVFVRDTCLGAESCEPKITRISLQPGDGSADGALAKPALSKNGDRIAAAGRDATLFTPGKTLSDSVFLAATRSKD